MTQWQWSVIIALCKLVLAHYWNWNNLSREQLRDNYEEELGLISEAVDKEDKND